MSSCVYKNVLLILFIGLFGFVTSCSTGPDLSSEISLTGSFDQTGLEGTAVNSFNQFEGKRYAATDNGLYRQASADSDWTSLGLTQKEVIDVVFLPGSKMLAAVRIVAFGDNIPSMFLSADDGQNWQPYMNDYGGDTEVTWVEALETISKPSDTLFAGGGILLAHSVNGGKNWQIGQSRWDLWGGKLNFLKADPHHQGFISMGGHNAIQWPFLFRSVDSGKSWDELNFVREGIETTVKDIWTSPNNTNNFLIATSHILRTNNNGKSWTSVFSEANVTTFAHSARNPEVVYASGQNADGTLFFAASKNLGESWETVEWSDSPPGVQVNDMISVMENGREVLYIGTNKGVYCYTFEE